jgi:hypothetical protein
MTAATRCADRTTRRPPAAMTRPVDAASETVARESSPVGERDERFAADADRADRIRGDRFGDGANRSGASQLTRATPAIRANQSRGRPSPDDRPRPEGSADAQRSNSAADAAGLEQLGLCIAGLKQPSARRGETTEAVALRKRGPSRRQSRSNSAEPGPCTLGSGRERMPQALAGRRRAAELQASARSCPRGGGAPEFLSKHDSELRPAAPGAPTAGSALELAKIGLRR